MYNVSLSLLKVRKKPKGRAKFIGQSKSEKEMALRLINEIRSQPVMALESLECHICQPPRPFTAPSTLLSHYRSHAGRQSCHTSQHHSI